MILTVCPNTALDKILFIEKWTPGVPMRTNNTASGVGGKGLDASVVLSQLGVETVGLGFFSGKIGKQLIEMLKAYGIIPNPVWVGGENRVAYVIAEESTHIHHHVIAGQVEVSAEQAKELIERFKFHVKNADWVILAGSLPPSVPPHFYHGLIEIAKEAGVPVLIDTQQAFIVEALSARPDVVKMNREEFGWTFGIRAPAFASLYAQAQGVRVEKQLNNLIITMGKDGILAITEEGNYLAKAPAQKPVNAAGAGDAVSSTRAWRLSLGDGWYDALHWASAVSAAAVLTKRTGDIDMEDVERIYPDVEVQTLH